MRVTISQRAAERLVEHDKRRAQEFFKTAVELLPGCSPHTLELGDQQDTLSQFSRLVNDAVSFFIDNPNEAVRLL